MPDKEVHVLVSGAEPGYDRPYIYECPIFTVPVYYCPSILLPQYITASYILLSQYITVPIYYCPSILLPHICYCLLLPSILILLTQCLKNTFSIFSHYFYLLHSFITSLYLTRLYFRIISIYPLVYYPPHFSHSYVATPAIFRIVVISINHTLYHPSPPYPTVYY